MNMIKVNNMPFGHRHARHSHPFADFDRIFNEFCGEGAECNWSPRTDIVETGSEHQLIIELPGLEKSDISIKVEDRMLMISGEVKRGEESDDLRFRRRERFSGSFSRKFRLPAAIDAEKIGAEFKNGLLTVILPKSEAAVGREIEVK